MPDPFAILPLPLPIDILNGFEDLVSLHALLVASPSAYDIFASHYAEILSFTLTHYPPHLSRLLRVILNLRSQPGKIREQCSASLHAFDAFRATTLLDENNNAGSAPPSKSTTTVTAARSLVKTAAQVQGLMGAFFQTHFKRVNRLKPHCPRNKKGGVSYKDQFTPLPNKEYVPYDIIPFEEPSWIEEQRVLRALWRIVLFLDLRIILAPRCPGGKDCDSPEEEGLNCIHTIFQTQGIKGLRGGPHVEAGTGFRGIAPYWWEEMECVVAFLMEESAAKLPPPVGLADNENPPQELQMLPNIQGTDHYHVVPQLPPSTGDDMALLWKQRVADLDRCSDGSTALYRARQMELDRGERRGCNMKDSVYALEYEPLRKKLGMLFWDGEKLARLGLYYNLDDIPPDIRERYLLGPPRGRRKGPRTQGPPRYELIVRWKSLFLPSNLDQANLNKGNLDRGLFHPVPA
ncbi:MAG: hypothetical protein L6R40_007157 [Gallowayella cf. fulva]|nr:MAG: hypothetical protein L6R40_007157 [Xanthomendoza cf. fulva]